MCTTSPSPVGDAAADAAQLLHDIRLLIAASSPPKTLPVELVVLRQVLQSPVRPDG